MDVSQCALWIPCNYNYLSYSLFVFHNVVGEYGCLKCSRQPFAKTFCSLQTWQCGLFNRLMLLLIFSSCVTNFAEEKYVIANFDFLNSCKKMPPALAHLKNTQMVFIEEHDIADGVWVSEGQDGKGSCSVRLKRFWRWLLLPVFQIIIFLSVTGCSERAAASSGKSLRCLKMKVILNKGG